MMSEQPVVVTPKPWYESKTILINGLVFLISVVVWIGESQTAGILPFDIDPETLAMILTALNLVLRFATSQPVSK